MGFMPTLGITSLVFHNLPDMIRNVVIMVTRAVVHVHGSPGSGSSQCPQRILQARFAGRHSSRLLSSFSCGDTFPHTGDQNRHPTVE